jgi:gluconokinase
LLFDRAFKHYPDIGHQEKYDIKTTPDGGVEVDAEELSQLTLSCLDALHHQMAEQGLKASAIAMSAFWHSFLGIDRAGRATTPIIHLFDTRSGSQVQSLARQLDGGDVHARTGCVLHTSYWPAKLLWLREERPQAFSQTTRWLSFGEYLLQHLHGTGSESISMMSASGIWNYRQKNYDSEILGICGVSMEQLAPLETVDQPVCHLKPRFASRWPLFEEIPWFPAYGDGACNSIGSGCTSRNRLALMVGTSGAMRIVLKTDATIVPPGLWCYRVNRDRFILGGALSNGGEVFRWLTRTLNLPLNPESQLTGRPPGVHGLTVLPYLAGERSPYWRPDLRGAIVGMSLSTTAIDILQASLEGVALRFKQIYSILTGAFASPDQVIASGGALIASKYWRQMMADALGHPIVECLEPEASSRGAALIAAEQLGAIDNMDTVPVELGPDITPIDEHARTFDALLSRDAKLFHALFEG